MIQTAHGVHLRDKITTNYRQLTREDVKKT